MTHNRNNQPEGIMKQSDLKNEIETGLRMTCGSWGESYIMLDEQQCFEAMVSSFGGIVEDYENQRDDENGDIDISIYQIDGNFFAVNNDTNQIISCDNPADCSDGMLAIYGQWQDFENEGAV